MSQLTPTEVEHLDQLRRERMVQLSAEAGERAALEARHGAVWNTEELKRDFEVEGFMAPFVVVRRRSDGRRGSLEFQGQPRFYFNFKGDSK